MNTDFNDAAIECARYIFDSDDMQVGYQEHIQNGEDPRNHILYCAAVVLGMADDFQIDIDEYLKEYNHV